MRRARRSQTPQQIVDTLLGYPERTRFQILAPVVKGRKGEFVDMIELLRSDATPARSSTAR